jgi:hypothetical protein
MLKAATLRKILGDKVFRKNKQNAVIDAYLNINPKNINITDKNKTRADVDKKTAIIKSAEKPQNIQEKVFSYFTPTIKDTANSVSRKGMADKREEYGNSSGTIQNTAIANSSRDVNMIEKADKRDEKIMTNNPALSWEPKTGHDKIEASYGVAFDTYDPDTGELNMRMKDSTGRTTNRVITENVNDDTYLNYFYSPSKGRWATNKDRQQDLERGYLLKEYPDLLEAEYNNQKNKKLDEGGLL